MRINLERSEYDKIKGLAEASIESPDVQLAAVLDYIKRSFKHLESFGATSGDAAWDVLFEVRDACMGELDRRRGDCFDYEKMLEVDYPNFLECLNAEDVTL